MEIKFFEVRDRATTIVVMATKLDLYDQEAYNRMDRPYKLLRRAGYGNEFSYILYHPMEGLRMDEMRHDPYAWNDRTHFVAHKYIRDNFDILENTAIIDVEFINGETTKIKETDI